MFVPGLLDRSSISTEDGNHSTQKKWLTILHTKLYND